MRGVTDWNSGHLIEADAIGLSLYVSDNGSKLIERIK
jgi:hypothetical protein